MEMVGNQIAIGNEAKVYSTKLSGSETNNSIAIGTKAEAYIFKSVAIGEGAQTLSVDFYNNGSRDESKRKKWRWWAINCNRFWSSSC